jgi:hypothetical protein
MTDRRTQAWGALPTDATADAVDRRIAQARIRPDPPDFDRAPVTTVLQAGARDRLVIPVNLTNPVNINVLPVRLGALFSVELVFPESAIKVLNADPRRAIVMLSSVHDLGMQISIGRSQAEADDRNGYSMSGDAGVHNFNFTGELWARAKLATVRLSVATENWTR